MSAMIPTSVGETLQASTLVRSIPRGNHHALYHRLYGHLCLVDDEVLALLGAFGVPRTADAVAREADVHLELVEELTLALHARHFLVPAGTDELRVVREALEARRAQLEEGTLVQVLQLVTTNLCNFRCSYCFTDRIYCSTERAGLQRAHHNKVMTDEVATAAVDLLLDCARRAGRSRVAIQFFGGEPLVNWRAIRHVLDRYGDGEKHGVRIGYSIVTNGSLVTEEMAQRFREHDVAVVVSFDSPLGEDRPLASGLQSRPSVERGLDTLARAGNRIVFNSVLSEETWAYFGPEVADYAQLFGVEEIGVLLDLDPAFFRRHAPEAIADRVWALYQHGRARGVLVTGYWHQIFQQLVSGGVFAGRAFKTCSATGAQLSVEPSGDVFACKGSSGYFGQVAHPRALFSSDRYLAYAQRAVQNAPACVGCDIEFFCGGLCLGSRERAFGTLAAVEDSSCAVYRDLTQRLVAEVGAEDVDVLEIAAPRATHTPADQPGDLLVRGTSSPGGAG